MGQARLRGSKEERARQGIEKRLEKERILSIAKDERDKQEQLRFAAMTPEQRHKMYKNRSLILGTALAFGLGAMFDV